MFGFFFKKNVCDIWDNFFYVVVCNIFSIIATFVSGFLFNLILMIASERKFKVLYIFIVVIFGCFLLSLVYFSNGKSAFRIANFDVPRYSDFFLGFQDSIFDAALLGFLEGILIYTTIVSLPYYCLKWAETKNLLQAIFASAIFWFLFATLFALQWFLGFRIILGNGFFKSLKKSYILLLDNLGFSLFLFLVNIANILLSILTFGLFPGLAGIAVTNVNAFRLLLRKYDWLETQSAFSTHTSKKIPWADLLADDKTAFGNRTVKGLFFPWLDQR